MAQARQLSSRFIEGDVAFTPPPSPFRRHHSDSIIPQARRARADLDLAGASPAPQPPHSLGPPPPGRRSRATSSPAPITGFKRRPPIAMLPVIIVPGPASPSRWAPVTVAVAAPLPRKPLPRSRGRAPARPAAEESIDYSSPPSLADDSSVSSDSQEEHESPRSRPRPSPAGAYGAPDIGPVPPRPAAKTSFSEILEDTHLFDAIEYPDDDPDAGCDYDENGQRIRRRRPRHARHHSGDDLNDSEIGKAERLRALLLRGKEVVDAWTQPATDEERARKGARRVARQAKYDGYGS